MIDIIKYLIERKVNLEKTEYVISLEKNDIKNFLTHITSSKVTNPLRGMG